MERKESSIDRNFVADGRKGFGPQGDPWLNGGVPSYERVSYRCGSAILYLAR
jgi:hypothetical protein